MTFILESLLEGRAGFTTILIILSIFVLTQAIKTIQPRIALPQIGDAKTPPIVPYPISFIGNLLPSLFDAKEFCAKMIFVSFLRPTVSANTK